MKAADYQPLELVESATNEGQTDLNATDTATTEVDLDEDDALTDARQTGTDVPGNYGIRMAHPGEYRVDGETVTVNEPVVWNGSSVTR